MARIGRQYMQTRMASGVNQHFRFVSRMAVGIALCYSAAACVGGTTIGNTLSEEKTAGVSGIVLDAETLAPVAGATVRIGDKEVQTDALGQWKFNTRTNGSAAFASKSGYASEAVSFSSANQNYAAIAIHSAAASAKAIEGRTTVIPLYGPSRAALAADASAQEAAGDTELLGQAVLELEPGHIASIGLIAGSAMQVAVSADSSDSSASESRESTPESFVDLKTEREAEELDVYQRSDSGTWSLAPEPAIGRVDASGDRFVQLAPAYDTWTAFDENGFGCTQFCPPNEDVRSLGEVYGQVLGPDNKPLADWPVAVVEMGVSVLTDQDGYFGFDNVWWSPDGVSVHLAAASDAGSNIVFEPLAIVRNTAIQSDVVLHAESALSQIALHTVAVTPAAALPGERVYVDIQANIRPAELESFEPVLYIGSQSLAVQDLNMTVARSAHAVREGFVSLLHVEFDAPSNFGLYELRSAAQGPNASGNLTSRIVVQNTPPVIRVDGPVAALADTSLQYKATAWDANNDALSYRWYVDGVTAQVVQANLLNVNGFDAGEHSVLLEVYDGANTSSTLLNVSIQNP